MALLPERDCLTCTKQIQWGCETDAMIPLNMDGEELYRCPRRPWLDNPQLYNELFDYYNWMEKGYLPDPGTYDDQGVKFRPFMGIIRTALHDAQKATHERQVARQHTAAAVVDKPSSAKPGGYREHRPRHKPPTGR